MASLENILSEVLLHVEGLELSRRVLPTETVQGVDLGWTMLWVKVKNFTFFKRNPGKEELLAPFSFHYHLA